MNQPRTVINFVNAAHFIDHYAMLVFAAAVIVMAPAFGTTYASLLVCAVPGSVAFGAGSLVTGWLGDRWSRRHMMVVFFLGIGAAMASVGFVNTPEKLAAALFALGAFASIYHPVGTAMLVARAEQLGREIGVNGVWGNLGVASSALVTGGICQWLGWRWAFVLPGLAAFGTGLWFMTRVRHEPPSAHGRMGGATRVPREQMRRVVVALAVSVIASSTAFNAITVSLPELFSERLSVLTTDPAIVGLIVAGTYLFGALAQYTIGALLDRRSLKSVFLPLSLLTSPLLMLAAGLSGPWLVFASIGIVIGLFGQVTINDAMVGRYTEDAWRSRAYAARYFVGFTAAGISVGAVAWLHERGGFGLTLQALGALCTLVIIGALIFPADSTPMTRPAPVRHSSPRQQVKVMRGRPWQSSHDQPRRRTRRVESDSARPRRRAPIAVARVELTRSSPCQLQPPARGVAFTAYRSRPDVGDIVTLTLELTDTANADDRRAILDPLMAFNRANAPDGHYRPLNVLLRGGDGNVTGGLWGRTDWGWFGIELLYVPETFRGQGIGAETVKAAEQEARTRGCRGAWVNTFGWQARGFYQSLGYALFGELPDCPTGHSRHFLKKRL